MISSEISIQTEEAYIHGFSVAEQYRLMEQAEALAPVVFNGLDFSKFNHMLEIGCGVGAQTKQLLLRWPHLKISSIDKNISHFNAAKIYLKKELNAGNVELFNGNASSTHFSNNQFDVAITIWVLEHVPSPVQILKEARRILKPGGYLILTEVDNDTFKFSPRNIIIENWWGKFNTLQASNGADPFIGQKLSLLAEYSGFNTVLKKRLPIIVSKHQKTEYRLHQLRYLRDLLLSGAESLRENGLASKAEEKALRHEFKALESQTEVQFQYLATRLIAKLA